MSPTSLAMVPSGADGKLLKRCLYRLPPWVTPNRLTLARLFLTPPLLYITWLGRADWALPLYLILALTDAIDGPLARMRGQTSKLGATLDQFSDKMLQMPMLLIAGYGIIPFRILLPLIMLEVLLMVMRPIQAAILKQGILETPKKFRLPGQIKMWAEGFTVFFLLTYRQTGVDALWGLSLLAATVSTGFALASVIAHLYFTWSASAGSS